MSMAGVLLLISSAWVAWLVAAEDDGKEPCCAELFVAWSWVCCRAWNTTHTGVGFRLVIRSRTSTPHVSCLSIYGRVEVGYCSDRSRAWQQYHGTAVPIIVGARI